MTSGNGAREGAVAFLDGEIRLEDPLPEFVFGLGQARCICPNSGVYFNLRISAY